jgi:DNA-binding transcriptional regulator of glucitol operon
MKNRNERREEMNAYGVMLLIGAFCICIIGIVIQTIFSIF